jgi:hypothetical protein
MVKKMSRKASRKSSCPSGKIERAAYTRKGYQRKSYSKKSKSGSKKIKGSYVSRASVPKSCVPAKGKAIKRGSKTPEREKVLPKIGKELHLRKYGYATNKSDAVRQAALRAASKDNSELIVLKHLNLIRNYQADPDAKRIMGKDVKYMSNKYAHSK